MKWPLIIRRVVGHSMEPTLKQGRVVLATPLLSVGEGDIVVAKHEDKEIIKRVKKVEEKGYFLEGDNSSHSRDSHRFGSIDKSATLGRVLFVSK
jgi:phage repressor protein C with HTH and peptisase S24 domain